MSGKNIGMMSLTQDNMIIRERVLSKFDAENDKGTYFNIKGADTDETHFHLVSKKPAEKGGDEVVTLSVLIPCFHELKANGLDEVLGGIYGDLLQETAEKEYSATIEVNLADLGGRTQEAVVALFARFKTNCMSAPLITLGKALQAGENGEPVVLNYRRDEQIVFIPKADRVQVLISLRFSDKVERAVAYVYATELNEDHKVFNQPNISYSPLDNPPRDLKGNAVAGASESEPEAGDIGHIVIGVTQNEISTPAQMSNTVDMCMSLRTYLDYHLKASKSQLMYMMRASCSKLLKAKARCETKGAVVKVQTLE